MSGSPEYFYKFTTVDRAVEILTKCKIFFPSPADFNDPFDCKFRPIVTASRLKRERFLRELARERKPRMPKALIKMAQFLLRRFRPQWLRLAGQATGRILDPIIEWDSNIDDSEDPDEHDIGGRG